MPCKVVHFEVLGKDGVKLRKFYGELFDWQMSADNPMNYGLVPAAGEGSIGGGIGQTDQERGHVTFYIEVNDVDRYLEKINQAGGSTIVPKTVIRTW